MPMLRLKLWSRNWRNYVGLLCFPLHIPSKRLASPRDFSSNQFDAFGGFRGMVWMSPLVLDQNILLPQLHVPGSPRHRQPHVETPRSCTIGLLCLTGPGWFCYFLLPNKFVPESKAQTGCSATKSPTPREIYWVFQVVKDPQLEAPGRFHFQLLPQLCYLVQSRGLEHHKTERFRSLTSDIVKQLCFEFGLLNM